MSEKRETILNALAAYHLISMFQTSDEPEPWEEEYQSLVRDTQYGEFQVLIGMKNLVTILAVELAKAWELDDTVEENHAEVMRRLSQYVTEYDFDDESKGR